MKHARANSIPAVILVSLLKLQDGLNKFIDVNWREKRSPDDWGLAVTMESCELIDSFPWKWWKNIGARPDEKNIRVELVDILHFSLSGGMQMHGKPLRELPAGVEDSIVSPLLETQNAVKTFRNVIALATLHRFDVVTSIVVSAAEDLGFNLVAYYVAKHTLNYIRQLGGYKEGTYKKVVGGQEDNELLHQCIADIDFSYCVAEDHYDASWNGIMSRVYDAFNVHASDRRKVKDWM
jgi:dUTP pyrophosphatase